MRALSVFFSVSVFSMSLQAADICRKQIDYEVYCEKAFFALVVDPSGNEGRRIGTHGFLTLQKSGEYILYFDEDRARLAISSESIKIIPSETGEIARFVGHYVRVNGIFLNVSSEYSRTVATLRLTMPIRVAPVKTQI